MATGISEIKTSQSQAARTQPALTDIVLGSGRIELFLMTSQQSTDVDLM